MVAPATRAFWNNSIAKGQEGHMLIMEGLEASLRNSYCKQLYPNPGVCNQYCRRLGPIRLFISKNMSEAEADKGRQNNNNNTSAMSRFATAAYPGQNGKYSRLLKVCAEFGFGWTLIKLFPPSSVSFRTTQMVGLPAK
jgi:hypothetical protein